MEPAITGQVVESAGARYGLLGIGIVILGFVIVWIVRRYLAVNDAVGKERELMVKEREQTIAREAALRRDHDVAIASLRAEFARERLELDRKHEAALREHSDSLRKELTAIVRETRDNETVIRREHAETIEKLEEEVAAASMRANVILEKLADRIILSTRQPGGRYP